MATRTAEVCSYKEIKHTSTTCDMLTESVIKDFNIYLISENATLKHLQDILMIYDHNVCSNKTVSDFIDMLYRLSKVNNKRVERIL